ncbi:MAG TPA: PAS domain S-box protein [Terriglobales bacterium]|nr:PAS domain S-box protein [Terriglobales bacterium]
MPSSLRRNSVIPEQTLGSGYLFRTLVDSVRDYAIFLLDPEGNIATWNPGAERIKGYKAHEIIGKNFRTFYPREDLDRDKPGHELKVAAAVGSYEDEGWRLRKDGSRFWANVVITRILDESGKLIGFGEVTRDLTERRESELQYRRLIEGVTDYAIFSLDAKGYVTSWNSGAKRLKGYESEEIVGQHFSRFYIPQDAAAGLPSRVLETAAAEGHYEGEGWRVRKDGTRFWSSVVVTPIRNEEGVLVGFSKITRDVTDRKRLLDQLQEHSKELELRIREREQTNAELEAFSYSVSHDLRAPLRAIEGFTDIILSDFAAKLPSEVKELLGHIATAAARMNRLVQDLLNYSRLSRMDLKLETVNVKAAITDACNQLDTEVRAGISVSAGPSLEVRAHGAVLRQVILNLLNNAVKFTKPGEPPRVEAKALRRGNYVHIQIKDEGIGIAPQHQERIFQVFERLHNAEEYPGTGIGLAIVRRGIVRLGGTVTLESELGKGSTFEIRLPAA